MLEEEKIKIWTDGACSGNPGEGGIGVVMKYKEHIKHINGYVPYTTNNQMELLALIIAIKHLKRQSSIELYTDSNYLKDGITKWIHAWKKNNWKTASKDKVKNQKLWQELDSLIKPHQINFFWVKGHSGQEENEQADSLCQQAIKNKAPLLQEYLELLKDD
jgi:ribonuclease HI